MNKKYTLIFSIIFLAIIFVYAPKIIAQIISELPKVTTTCEMKNGFLMSINDGFSNFQECPNGARQVAVFGEQGPKGDKGDTGEAANSKNLKTFDNNGNELGIYIDTDTFFETSLQKRIKLDNGEVIAKTPIYFESSDCSGTAYLVLGSTSLSGFINDIISAGRNKYFVLNRQAAGEIKTYNSAISGGTSCKTVTMSYSGLPLIPVTLPFSLPVAMPLEYKYQ